MKKFGLLLVAILGFNLINILTVKADSSSFYEGEYISGIYLKSTKGGVSNYQKARFFRRSGDNLFAYCIEPFKSFNANSNYDVSINPTSISEETWQRLSLISYFGYNYPTHTDTKWYAITQLMLWKTIDPGSDYYFTDSLNGNRINVYTNEINEINTLINNYLTTPSFNNSKINIVEDSSITISDSNNILNNFKTNNDKVVIDNNNLTISNLKEGVYTIDLDKSDNYYNVPPLFYYSGNSQNIMTVGKAPNISAKLTINVIKTQLKINKIDKDTNSTIPSGEGELKGASYELYDSNNKLISVLTIDDSLTAILNNLNFGKYFLKEVEAGPGYKVDSTVYEIIIDENNTKKELTLANEIIKNKVEINKEYGDGNTNSLEGNASFQITNNKSELITTITTDNSGHAEIILPFGKYLFTQISGINGYKLNEPFTVDVNNDNDKLNYNLYDYKIKVPNTGINNNCYIIYLLIITTIGLVYAQKNYLNKY